MKIKFSGLGVVAGSGKINGTVASRNRSGAYARVKVTPVNPNTADQQAARATLAAYSQGWRNLTPAQRDAWNNAVKGYARTDIFGDLRNPTGKNLYTRLNANIVNVGGAAITVPPIPTAIPSAAVSLVTIAVGAVQYDVAFTDGGPTLAFQVWATPPLSPGVSFVKSEYRLISSVNGGGGTPYDFSVPYLAKFGAAVPGEKVFVKMVCVGIASGNTGIATSQSTIALV